MPKGILSLDLLASIFPTLILVSVFVFATQIESGAEIFERSRLAIALGDKFLLSCDGTICKGSVVANVWNESIKLNVEKIKRETGLSDFQVGEVKYGNPTYFVPRIVFDKTLKVIWFGVS